MLIDRAPSVVSREIRRNALVSCPYALAHAGCQARRARRRPRECKVAIDAVLRARALENLDGLRTPRQVAGCLRLEAQDDTASLVRASLPAQGRTVSHEAIYQYIYVLPKGVLAAHGTGLRSQRTRRRPAPTSTRWALRSWR